MAIYKSNISRRKLRGRRKIKLLSRKSNIIHRLSVFRSNNHIYSQVIDMSTGNVIVSASTVEKEFTGSSFNIDLSNKVGKLLAERAIKSKVKQVIFDKSGYKYHGKVKGLAEGAREAGLIF